MQNNKIVTTVQSTSIKNEWNKNNKKQRVRYQRRNLQVARMFFSEISRVDWRVHYPNSSWCVTSWMMNHGNPFPLKTSLRTLCSSIISIHFGSLIGTIYENLCYGNWASSIKGLSLPTPCRVPARHCDHCAQDSTHKPAICGWGLGKADGLPWSGLTPWYYSEGTPGIPKEYSGIRP
jgi:hypothetical protein